MGFRTNAFATVWEVTPKSDVCTDIRLSVSKKNKETGEYDVDFSGFVRVIGKDAAKKAANLKEKDKIRLGDVDVSTNYDKEKKVTYTNYKMFSFDNVDSNFNSKPNDGYKAVDDGDIEAEELPF